MLFERVEEVVKKSCFGGANKEKKRNTKTRRGKKKQSYLNENGSRTVLNPRSCILQTTLTKSATIESDTLPHRPSGLVCPFSKPNQLIPLIVKGRPSTPMKRSPRVETGFSSRKERPGMGERRERASEVGEGGTAAPAAATAQGAPSTETPRGAKSVLGLESS